MADESAHGKGDPDKRMIAVPIKDLMKNTVVTVNLYVRLSESKYVLVAKAGNNMNHAALKNYQTRGAGYLYVKASEYGSLVTNNISIASEVAEVKGVGSRQKVALFEQAAKSVMVEIQTMGFNREIFVHAKAATEALAVLAEDKQKFADFIGEMAQLEGSHVTHSVAVSLVSVMLGVELQWTNPVVLEKLSLGGFLHDIGETKLPLEVLSKPVSRLKKDELTIYQSHCEIGREMVKNMPFIPEDVIAIVHQHHENSLGNGFPNRTKELLVNPLARVVALANEFCNLTLKSVHNQPLISPREALAAIEIGMGQPYERDVFEALKRLLQVSEKKSA